MKILHQLRLPVGTRASLKESAARRLKIAVDEIDEVLVIKRSLDARKRGRPYYVYSVRVRLRGEPPPPPPAPLPRLAWRDPLPVIVGSGPAGLFAALRLADQGVRSILIERGQPVHPRTVSINMFWKHGRLDPESNVCFGEGGAGLFSDGKLITRIRSPHIEYVLRRLVDFGAPPEIRWESNPHVGSNRLRTVIQRLAAYLREQGCTMHFNSRLVELLLDGARRVRGIRLADGRRLEASHLILATGHSAADVYAMLRDQGVELEAKPFAVGIRVEHPQHWVNTCRLGARFARDLGAASWKQVWHDHARDRHVYSFCMCPGGYVLSSGTEPDGIVVNGMSNFSRGSKWANAALVSPVDLNEVRGGDPFRLHRFQRELEKRAFEAVRERGGGHRLPAQRIGDFMDGKASTSLPRVSSPSGAIPVPMDAIFPDKRLDALREAIAAFDRRMPGFITRDGVMLAVESRTSAPIRIPRDPVTFQSVNTPGLYPVGEGAGYAGGITSAAVDGIRAVAAIGAKGNIPTG